MSTFSRDTPFADDPVATVESNVDNTPKRTVDLVPCNFQGTFQNPCFWVLIGIIGTIGVQYLFKKD